MKIKTCISTLRKLQFNRIKDVDELIEITGMVYEADIPHQIQE